MFRLRLLEAIEFEAKRQRVPRAVLLRSKGISEERSGWAARGPDH